MIVRIAAVALCGSLSFASQHPRWHAIDADVMVEVPDVQATLTAYETAPLVRMLRGDAAASIGELAKGMGWDIGAMVGGLLPKPDPARPDDPRWPWSKLASASFSIEGLDASSTGTNFLEHVAGCAVLEFSEPDACSQAALAIVDTLALAPKADAPAAKLDLDAQATEITHYTGELSFAGMREVWIARSERRLVLGGGRTTPELLARRLSKTESSLASKFAAEPLFGQRTGVLVADVWSDIESNPFQSLLGDVLPTNAFASDLVAAFVPFVGQRGRTQLELTGDRFVTQSAFERVGSAVRVDAFMSKAPVSASASALVPKEAIGAWVVAMDPQAIERALYDAFAPGSELASQADAPKLAPFLGSSAAFYMFPFAGVPMGGAAPKPKAAMAIELRDRAGFEAAFATWLERAKAAQPGLKVESKPYHKFPFFTFTLPSGAAAPSDDESDDATKRSGGASGGDATLAILDDRVLVALTKDLARNEIKRFEAKSTERHALASEGRIPKDAFEASTMDWGGMLGKVYELARGFVPMMAQGAEKPIDVSKLPTADALFAPFQPSLSWSKRVGDRIYTRSESSFGPETPLAIGMIGFAATRVTAAAGSARAGATKTDVVAPAAPEAAVDDQLKSTVRALRSVKTGIAVFRSQKNAVPAKLDDLLQPTDSFPKGFLESGVPLDGWQHALVYKADVAASKYELYSVGPNGIDDAGAGDDVRAP